MSSPPWVLCSYRRTAGLLAASIIMLFAETVKSLELATVPERRYPGRACAIDGISCAGTSISAFLSDEHQDRWEYFVGAIVHRDRRACRGPRDGNWPRSQPGSRNRRSPGWSALGLARIHAHASAAPRLARRLERAVPWRHAAHALEPAGQGHHVQDPVPGGETRGRPRRRQPSVGVLHDQGVAGGRAFRRGRPREGHRPGFPGRRREDRAG
jgi:hypothetical protein